MSRYKYSIRKIVSECDCDPFLRLRTSVMLRYIQTVAAGQLDELGLNYERLFKEGFVFVSAAIALKIFRTPISGEEIIVSTAPLAPERGANMLRETVIETVSGERLAECQTNWVLIDSTTGKLRRACEFPHQLPLLEGEWKPFFDPRKIRIKPISDKSLTRTVRLSDIDRNFHMNNTVYADVILDCFGEEFFSSGGVDTILIRYHLQARMGDTLNLDCGYRDGIYTVSANCGDKKCFEGCFSLKSP